MRRPPEKRTASPGRLTPIANQDTNGPQDTSDDRQHAIAARHVSRRFALRLSIAAVIAAEIGLGGAQ